LTWLIALGARKSYQLDLLKHKWEKLGCTSGSSSFPMTAGPRRPTASIASELAYLSRKPAKELTRARTRASIKHTP
jgi:hypothetical protein